MTEDVISQKAILQWALDTFGRDVAGSTKERALRFIEEALELGQACQLTPDEVSAVVSRVWDRPRGDPHKETGQAAMTLYALAEWLGIDVADALLREWRRVQSITPEEWERRQNAKADVGIASRMGDG